MCWEIYFRSKAMPAGKDGVRRSRWAVIRNTKEQLKDTTIRTWEEWFPDPIAGRFVSSEMTFYLEYEDIKAEILFRALDKPDDIRKLLSMELTGAFVNEAREVPWAVIDGLTGRVGRYPRYRDMEHIKPDGVDEDPETGVWQYPDGTPWEPYWSGIIMDTNPPDEDHWWYKKFEIQMHEEPQVAELYRLFKQPPAVLKEGDRYVVNKKAENLKNLKPGYYESMVVGKDPEWVKVYAMGQYGIVSEGRPVHNGYNDEWHCREYEFDPKLPVYVGWDYSFRGQACVLAQLSKRGQLRIFEEFVGEETGISLEDFVFNAVKPGLAKYNATYQASVGDPAGVKKGDLDERFALGLLNDVYEEVQFNLPFTTEAADTNSLGPRLEGVDHFLNRSIDGAPALVLHPRCSILRKGFLGRYEYKRVQVVGEERFKDVPNKNRYSHPQDALQYLIRGILMDAGYSEQEEFVEERNVGISGY